MAAPPADSVGQACFEELMKASSSGDSEAMDHALLSLGHVYGKNFGKALEIVDGAGVLCFQGEVTGRKLYQVQGHKNEQYLVLPRHFCSCQSFYFDVVSKNDAVCCKHQLAVRAAVALGRCQTHTVSDVQIAEMLVNSWWVHGVKKMAAVTTRSALEGQLGSPKAKIARMEPEQTFKVKKLNDFAILPKRGSVLAAGYDLSSSEDAVVPARGKAMVATGLSIKCPPGTYGRVAPRSGLTWKNSIDTGAGVIDEDYRGEVKVILFNHSEVDFQIKRGDRIAQLILERIVTPEVEEVEDLDATDRGAGGFGSTGVAAQ